VRSSSSPVPSSIISHPRSNLKKLRFSTGELFKKLTKYNEDTDLKAILRMASRGLKMTETSSPEDAELLVQKLPSDMGIHRIDRKGTLKAPEKLLDDFEFEADVFVDEVFPDEFDLENNHRRIEHNTQEMLEFGKPVLSIGGDHSVSFAVIKTLKRQNPDLQLVWLDAHMDLKEKVGNHISHDIVVRELLNSGFTPDEVWLVGITEVDHDEKPFLDTELNVYRSDEVEEFLGEFKASEQPVYLSVDIDVLEGLEGTGYPDHGELEMGEVKDVIEAVKPDFADLVEVAPPFDQGETVEKSREIISQLEESLS